MTAKTRTTLKGVFEDGDATSGDNFADLIDSFLSLSDTSAQSVTSPVTFTTIGATTASATTFQGTTVSASAIHGSAAKFTTVSASSVYASSISVGGTELVSLAQPYGGLYFTSAQATVISSAGEYYKAGGGTALTNNSSHFTMPVDNRLLYSDSLQRHFHVVVQATVDLASGTNQVLGIQLYHYNASAAAGALIAHSEAHTFLAATDVEQITTHADLSMKNGDYVELWISNETGTPNATVNLGYVFLMGMLT